MLKCKDIAHLASQYADSDLSLWMKLKVKLHLMMCVACQRYVAHMRKTIVMIKQMNRPGISESDMSALKSAFAKSKNNRYD